MKIIELVLGLLFLVFVMNMGVNIIGINNSKIENYISHLREEAIDISLINWSNYFINVLTGSPTYKVVVNGKIKYVWTGYIIFKEYNFLTSDSLKSDLLYNCRLDDYNLPGGILIITGVFCRFYTNRKIFYNYRYY